MRSFRTERGYLLRLDAGEEVIEELTRFVAQNGIAGGTITGIGAVRETILGYFDLEARAYSKREFTQELELVGLNGNITWLRGAPLIHAHATVSGPDFVAHAGHLFAARIAVTGELFLAPDGVRINRAPDDRTGLNLIDG